MRGAEMRRAFHQHREPNHLQKAASLAEIVNLFEQRELTWAQNGTFFLFFFFAVGCINAERLPARRDQRTVWPCGTINSQETLHSISYNWLMKKINNSSCLAGMSGTGILVSFGSGRWSDWWLERLERFNFSDWTVLWSQPLPLPLEGLILISFCTCHHLTPGIATHFGLEWVASPAEFTPAVFDPRSIVVSSCYALVYPGPSSLDNHFQFWHQGGIHSSGPSVEIWWLNVPVYL